MSGWLAQWEEMIQDKEQKIARPRQVYLGAPERHFVPFEKRTAKAVPAPGVLTTA
jgi:citrate synthase